MAPATSQRCVSITTMDEDSVSDSVSGAGDEKTIPFLRRLRDMLLENEEYISFVPGEHVGDRILLGRIIVHDRIEVERTILPRYFNHSSFASFRRQLNYFSFVRLGKGRQRESAYINEGVVQMEDLLQLKRRPAGSVASTLEDVLGKEHIVYMMEDNFQRKSMNSGIPVVYVKKSSRTSSPRSTRRTIKSHLKRTLDSAPAKCAGAVAPSVLPYVISEDEYSDSNVSHVALDLTRPKADEEMLAGCSALLDMAKKGW